MKQIIELIVKEKRDVGLSILFGALAGLTSVALFGLSGFMIAKSALQPPLYIITIMTALLKLFGAAKAGSRYMERYVSHRATFSMLSRLRVSFYERLEPLVPRLFQQYRSGDLLARVVGDVESLQNAFLRVAYPPVVVVIVFLATVFFTLFYSVWIALLLLAGLLLTAVVVPGLLAVRQKRIMTTVRENRARLSVETAELLYGFRELKIHQRLDERNASLQAAAGEYTAAQEKEGVQAAASQALNAAAAMLVSFSVLALGAYFVTIGDLDGLFLAMLLMISLTVFDNAVPMALFPAFYEESDQASRRLFSVVEQDFSADRPKQPFQSDQAFSLSLDGVIFTYPGEERPALRNVSISLPAGSKTAIVGASGSGKSTVMQLLLQQYEADQGTVRVAGEPVQSFEEETVWRQMNVMLQSNHFFFGTVRDNVAIADEQADDRDITKALKQAQLPLSLDAAVLEKGENLSGGEKQRLALARLFLKGAPVWLLDEPMSSLDVTTERNLLRSLFESAEGDTVLFISHRLTSLEKMDQIIVMERGEVAEQGTYEELMKKQGLFWALKQLEQGMVS